MLGGNSTRDPNKTNKTPAGSTLDTPQLGLVSQERLPFRVVRKYLEKTKQQLVRFLYEDGLSGENENNTTALTVENKDQETMRILWRNQM